MARIKGTNIISTNFEPTVQAPLDSRLVVALLADLVAPETYIAKNYYKGMTVTVQEDGSIWTLMDPDNIVSWDSWVKQTSGTSSKEVNVVDSLESESKDSALSANQGRILNEKIEEIVESKGAANGIATLDESGKVPSAQLPSYVDDVLEFPTKADFPEVGEKGKIYVDIETNTTWRWGGSEYANVGSSLALGETSETAWAGDKGKATQEHVERLQDDLSYIADTVIPEMNENTAKALDQKVQWDATKSVISLPSKGSVAAIRPGQEDAEDPEGALLLGQRVYKVNGEDLVVTEVGSVKNELTLNSKSGLIKVDGPDGQKTVAYLDDITEDKEKIEALEEAVGKPATEELDATGLYKALEESLSWWEEEETIVKWDGVSKTEPAYDEETLTYSITNGSELAWLADNVEALDNKVIVLENDVDLDNKSWNPIGTSTGSVKNNPNVKHFKGVFDGNGHVIKNLTCEISDDYAKVGLFGAFQGMVKNLIVDGANLKSTHYTGVFVPYNTGAACIIENCEAKNVTIIDTPALNEAGEMDNGDKAGVIAGYISSNGSKITGCKVTNAFVKAYRDLGGIVGYIGSNKITVDITNNTLKTVNLVQDYTNGYKPLESIEGHVGTIYGWKDNNTVNVLDNEGEANITIINPDEEGSN